MQEITGSVKQTKQKKYSDIITNVIVNLPQNQKFKFLTQKPLKPKYLVQKKLIFFSVLF